MTTTHVVNLVPSKSVDTTPYELWFGREVDLTRLRPWGCAAYTHQTDSRYGKLGPRGMKGIFIRYSENSKVYLFVAAQENGGVVEHESIDITFLEDEFPTLGNIKTPRASMKANSVWSLVDLSSNHRAIGAKWVLKLKLAADGAVERYKS